MYKGQVALNGDPREAGAAFAAVMAASIANGGSFDDILPGIEYFAKLKASGNMSGTDVTEASVISGDTPVWIDWTYNYPGLAPKLDRKRNHSFQSRFQLMAFTADTTHKALLLSSPHPNAAKLWIDHIISDEGALGYIEGGAIPARFAALEAAGKITEDMKKNLPEASLLDGLKFLQQEQIAAAKEVLAKQWGRSRRRQKIVSEIDFS